jgi:hypothetical protein
MSNAPPLWGDPDPISPQQPEHTKLSRPRKPSSFRRVVAITGFPIDIDAWLEANEPDEFDALMDLRRALYSFRSHGRYRIRYRGETGPESFVLIGPAGKLLIRNHKSRYYLLRQLSRLRRKRRWPPIKYQ